MTGDLQLMLLNLSSAANVVLLFVMLSEQVQTYQISTMTVSQRNALARTWIEEGNANSNLNQLSPAAEAPENNDNDSGSSNDGNDEPQKDVLETWMIMVSLQQRLALHQDTAKSVAGCNRSLLDDLASCVSLSSQLHALRTEEVCLWWYSCHFKADLECCQRWYWLHGVPAGVL